VTGSSTAALLAAVAALAVGTYAYRIAGPCLETRVRLGERARELADRAAVVLLTALVAVATLWQAGSASGVARPAGVLVGGLLAWLRAPFLVVVVAAAATAALLRAVFGLR